MHKIIQLEKRRRKKLFSSESDENIAKRETKRKRKNIDFICRGTNLSIISILRIKFVSKKKKAREIKQREKKRKKIISVSHKVKNIL